MKLDDQNYKEQWDLMRQMVDYHMERKKYITAREMKHIIRVCESKDKNIVLIKPEAQAR